MRASRLRTAASWWSTRTRGSEPAQTALLHADFGVAGEQENQNSTISITIGEVLYGQPNPQTEGEDLAMSSGR